MNRAVKKGITWLGSYERDVFPQNSPNSFKFEGKVYNIDGNGYWELKPGVICWKDPWVESGELCGFIIEDEQTRARDRELAEREDEQYQELYILVHGEEAHTPVSTVAKVIPKKTANKKSIPCKFGAKKCKFGKDCGYNHTPTCRNGSNGMDCWNPGCTFGHYATTEPCKAKKGKCERPNCYQIH